MEKEQNNNVKIKKKATIRTNWLVKDGITKNTIHLIPTITNTLHSLCSTKGYTRKRAMRLIIMKMKTWENKGIDIYNPSKYFRIKIKNNDLILQESDEQFDKRVKYFKAEDAPITKNRLKSYIKRDGLKYDWFHEIYSGHSDKYRNKEYFYILKEEYVETFDNLLKEDYKQNAKITCKRFVNLLHKHLKNKNDKVDKIFIENNKIKSWKKIYKLLNEHLKLDELEDGVEYIINFNNKEMNIENICLHKINPTIYDRLKDTPRSHYNLIRIIKSSNLNKNDFDIIFVKNVDSENLYIATLKEDK